MARPPRRTAVKSCPDVPPAWARLVRNPALGPPGKEVQLGRDHAVPEELPPPKRVALLSDLPSPEKLAPAPASQTHETPPAAPRSRSFGTIGANCCEPLPLMQEVSDVLCNRGSHQAV